MARISELRLHFLHPMASAQGVFFADAVLASLPEALVPGNNALVLRAAVNAKDVREAKHAGNSLDREVFS